MDIEQFRSLAARANEIVVANAKRDEDYEDAPEEFIGEFDMLLLRYLTYCRLVREVLMTDSQQENNCSRNACCGQNLCYKFYRSVDAFYL